MANTKENYAIWLKHKKVIERAYIKALRKDRNILARIPDSCLLTMNDVDVVVNNNQIICVLHNDNKNYEKMTILDVDNDMLDKIGSEAYTRTNPIPNYNHTDGTKRIGYFYGKTKKPISEIIYLADFVLSMRWHDPRLKFTDLREETYLNTLSSSAQVMFNQKYLKDCSSELITQTTSNYEINQV